MFWLNYRFVCLLWMVVTHWLFGTFLFLCTPPYVNITMLNALQAMLGCVWAVVAELMTGLRVVDQVNTPGSSGLFWLLTATQITIWASLIPLFNGESPDSRRYAS